MSPVTNHGFVSIAEDGLPVLALDRPVTNAEVLAAIDEDRAER